MAQRHINTKNGAVALPTGANGVFSSMEVDESVGVDDVSTYGTQVYGAFLTNGTPVQRLTVGGFANHGAATTSPGFGGAAIIDADGGAATLTFDTGSTLAGSYILSRIRTSHSRMRAAVPTTWELQSAGDITTTWAAS